MLKTPDFAKARKRMIDKQIARRGIGDPRVLAALREVPREAFVDPGLKEFAYEDSPLPIAEGQTISQPYIVALMAEAAGISPSDKVLEVGAGSGYAAAVLSRMAARVFAIERHGKLADQAQARLQRLGYGNVEVMTGDGTRGWPDEAPFDVIIVSAGAQEVPEALRAQLAIGGRLIVPVGSQLWSQTLLKLTGRGKEDFVREDLGRVMFVPLIGDQKPRGEEAPAKPAEARPVKPATLPERIAWAAEPCPELGDPAFARMFDRFADRRVVLLGEASHGTSEFYRARAEITRHLVENHGFTIVAVEADWPDAAAVNRYVRGRPAPTRGEPAFQRFPTWMWRNTDVDAFVEGLRAYNATVEADRQAGFYGLDIYSMSSSIAAVLGYLDEVDPQSAAVARERYGCLTPWQKEPSTYGRAVLTESFEKCEQAVIAQCRELLARQLEFSAHDGERFFDAAQNARIVAKAERYYRIMYYGGSESWNLRDQAMFETLERLLEFRGADAKAVVWAHNSHIGDARHTEMGEVRNELNLGQLCRERFGEGAAPIGFGTHTGTVAAASNWGGPMEVMRVLPSREGSYERLCHEAQVPRFLLDFNRQAGLGRELAKPRLERFIGVIYRPETEVLSHYAEASLPQQFDAFVWFDESNAVTPLRPQHARPGVPDTYPFGV